MKNIFLKKRKLLIVICLLLIVIFSSFTLANSVLDSGTKVEPNSELVYYIDVIYDGIDENGVVSDGTNIVDLYSSEITITDKLPAGLIYNGVVDNGTGGIGAVMYNAESKSCSGHVVNDVDGITYDEATGTVSFVVKDLQAGCKITVGIKTMTPGLGTETRKDFYNTASGQEGSLSVMSNTVHVWMGQENAQTYTVTYKYDDSLVPSNAPSLPMPSDGTTSFKYTPGSIVSVAADVSVEGYNFLGWEPNVTLTYDSEGKFVMPEEDVIFVGSFEEKPTYTVSYQIDGEYPTEYIKPIDKEYYPGEIVILDALSEGTSFDGFTFNGWNVLDETIVLNTNADGNKYFVMPENDINISGSFTEILYEVSYQFQGDLPDTHEQLLPSSHFEKPGATVTLQPEPADVDNYEFVGWYAENGFTMPEENVVIIGEWIKRVGYFAPKIEVSVLPDICSSKFAVAPCYARPNGKAWATLTITNDEIFPIKDVLVQVEEVICDDVIECYDDTYNRIEISTIAASSSVQLTIPFTIPSDAIGTMDYNVEIIGASADNDYILKEGDYTAKDTYDVQSLLTICNELEGTSNPKAINQYRIKSDNFTTWMPIKDNDCRAIYISPGSYEIYQLDRQGYTLVSVEGAITTNGEILAVEHGLNYEVTFKNKVVSNKWLRIWDKKENQFSINVS